MDDTSSTLRVEWLARKRMWAVRVRLVDGSRVRIPMPDARSEAEAIALAPDIAAAAKVGGWTGKPKAPKAMPRAASAPVSRPSASTVLDHAREWIKSQTYAGAHEDSNAIELHLVASPFGALALSRVGVPAAREFVRWLVGRTSKYDRKPLAPRYVRTLHNLVSRAVQSAVDDELILANPLAAKATLKLLPAIADKVPGQRKRRKYTREQVVTFITDPRLSKVRRMTNALLFLGGPRPGEVFAARIRSYERDVQPLRRIGYDTSIERRTRAEEHTKTGSIKEVPVHPVLAEMLDAWIATGWRETFGRDPTPDDLLVPTFAGRGRRKAGGTVVRPLTPQRQNHFNEQFGEDCELLEIPLVPLKVQAMRRTFVDLCLEAGADRAVIREVTHRKRSGTSVDDAFNAYHDGASWERLCAELLKLRLDVPASTAPSGSGPSISSRIRANNLAVAERQGRKDTKIIGNQSTNETRPTRPSGDASGNYDERVEAPGVEPGLTPANGGEGRGFVSPASVSTPLALLSVPVADERGPRSGPADPIAAAIAALESKRSAEEAAGNLQAADEHTATIRALRRSQLASAPVAPAGVIPIARGRRRR